MTKQFLCSCRPTLAASLMMSLIASLFCGIARADDLGAGKSFPLPAAAFSPIGKVDVKVLKGEVLVGRANRVARTESQTRRIYILRRINPNPKYDPSRPKPQGTDINKHPGEQEKITLLAQYVDKTTTNQPILFQPGIVAGDAQSTGERPAIGKRILFKLSQPIGELSQVGGPIHTGIQATTVTTDGQGLATVIFTAGANPGLADIVATMEDLGQNEETTSWTGHIVIEKAGLWRRHKRTLSIAAVVAVTIVFIIFHPRKKPLKQQGPPVIP